jgi:hypothetical protein
MEEPNNISPALLAFENPRAVESHVLGFAAATIGATR